MQSSGGIFNYDHSYVLEYISPYSPKYLQLVVEHKLNSFSCILQNTREI